MEHVGKPATRAERTDPFISVVTVSLNAALTVRAGEPNSHAAIWAPFTDAVIQTMGASVGDDDVTVLAFGPALPEVRRLPQI